MQMLQRLPAGAEVFSAPPCKQGGRRRYFGRGKWATVVFYDPPVTPGVADDVAAVSKFIPSSVVNAFNQVKRSRVGKATCDRFQGFEAHGSKLLFGAGQLGRMVMCWLIGLASACASAAVKFLGGDGRVLLLRCQLYGSAATALVDSGASRSFISANLVKKLGVKPARTLTAVEVTLADKRVVVLYVKSAQARNFLR